MGRADAGSQWKRPCDFPIFRAGQRVPYVLDSTLALCYCFCCTYHHAASVISTAEAPTTWSEM